MATNNKTLNTRIKMKRDTSANWTSNNPVLLDGEIIIVDTAEGEVRFKIGDGTKTYSQLPFEDEAIRNLITTEVADLQGQIDLLPMQASYGNCSTAAATAAKTVSAGDQFTLETGAIVVVKFTFTNTAASPTLNVNETGAKAIYYKGAAITASYLKANYTYQFVYNGTQWDLIGEVDTNTNTDEKVVQSSTSANANYPLLLAPAGQTASKITSSYFNSNVTLNPSTKTIKANLDGNATTSTRATQDASGNIIAATYAKLANPIFTGTPKAPTAATGTNSTQIATTAFVKKSIDNIPVSDWEQNNTEASDFIKNRPFFKKVTYKPIVSFSGINSNNLYADEANSNVLNLYNINSIIVDFESNNRDTVGQIQCELTDSDTTGNYFYYEGEYEIPEDDSDSSFHIYSFSIALYYYEEYDDEGNWSDQGYVNLNFGGIIPYNFDHIIIRDSSIPYNEYIKISSFYLPDATTTGGKGIVALSSSVTSTSFDKAATSSAVKTVYDLASAALPKTGDTVTGKIYSSATNGVLGASSDNSAIRIDGGTSYDKGAFLTLHGKDSAEMNGGFQLVASNNDATRKELKGQPDGTLLWDNNKIYHEGNKPTAADINAFGRGGGIWSGTNLNDFKSFEAILITSNKTNQPPNAASYATVWNICGDGVTYLIQNYFDAVNKKYYHREYVDGAWNSWKTNIDSANISTQAVNWADYAGTANSANAVTNTLNTSTKYYVTGTTSSSTNTGGQIFDTGVYVDTAAGKFVASTVYGAVWNDYAEYRQSDVTEAGRVVCENGDDTLSLAAERLQPGANVVSDTFGFAIGETDECKTPIAVSGRVLAYPYEDCNTYEPGDAVCAAPNGTVSKMTREEIREYPERIIGTVSAIPTYETWGTGNVKVNGRIWIKVR